MKSKKLPPLKFLQECFSYSPVDGRLVYKQRPRRHFVDLRRMRVWNTRHSGKEAFYMDDRGYLQGHLDGHRLYAHRVIWKIMTGDDPPSLVDHKDRDRRNNRWTNLRLANHSQNAINSTMSKGVLFDKSRGKWMAYTKINQKMINIGRFDCKKDAEIARAAKVKELFGEFAP